jgi:hypothetical protein
MTKGWNEVEKTLRRIERHERGGGRRKLTKADRKILLEYFRNVGVSFLVAAPLLLLYLHLAHLALSRQ